MTSAQVTKLLAPLLADFDKMGVVYTSYVTQTATYYDHYAGYFGPLPYGKVTLGIVKPWMLPGAASGDQQPGRDLHLSIPLIPCTN